MWCSFVTDKDLFFKFLVKKSVILTVLPFPSLLPLDKYSAF